MTFDYHLRKKLTFIIIPILLLAVQSFTYAQSNSGRGQIRGVVTDTTTGSALFGANVYLEGTSLGSATNIDGKYNIAEVPAGSYDLVVRYIGYRQKTFHLKVEEGTTVELNVSLLSQAIETQSVTVTAQAAGQTEAINQQLTSNTIVNVVSAERIHQLPDANAATALSRLPGVSLMNGDQVVIRGVQAKLNQILINGIELPSTDMNTRATDLGFISSNLLSGIEVIKALTPDMDANALGGVVNLRLREAPTGFHFDVLTQGSYNSTDRVSDNYTFWASASDRFLDDKLGVFIQGNMDRTDGGNQVASITPSFLGTSNNAYGQATYITSAANFEYDADIVKNSGGTFENFQRYKKANSSR
jgi:outer membrane receptor for ferrienterochelin and colicin